jgi:hypothetical protein
VADLLRRWRATGNNRLARASLFLAGRIAGNRLRQFACSAINLLSRAKASSREQACCLRVRRSSRHLLRASIAE